MAQMPFRGYSNIQTLSKLFSDDVVIVSTICLTPLYIDLTTGTLSTILSPMRINWRPNNPFVIAPISVVNTRKITTPTPLILKST